MPPQFFTITWCVIYATTAGGVQLSVRDICDQKLAILSYHDPLHATLTTARPSDQSEMVNSGESESGRRLISLFRKSYITLRRFPSTRLGENQYIQVDLEQPSLIRAVISRGCASTVNGSCERQVTKYRLQYSLDKRKWNFLHSLGKEDRTMSGGDGGRLSFRRYNLACPVIARYLRVYAVSHPLSIRLTLDIQGCPLHTEKKKVSKQERLTGRTTDGSSFIVPPFSTFTSAATTKASSHTAETLFTSMAKSTPGLMFTFGSVSTIHPMSTTDSKPTADPVSTASFMSTPDSLSRAADSMSTVDSTSTENSMLTTADSLSTVTKSLSTADSLSTVTNSLSTAEFMSTADFKSPADSSSTTSSSLMVTFLSTELFRTMAEHMPSEGLISKADDTSTLFPTSASVATTTTTTLTYGNETSQLVDGGGHIKEAQTTTQAPQETGAKSETPVSNLSSTYPSHVTELQTTQTTGEVTTPQTVTDSLADEFSVTSEELADEDNTISSSTMHHETRPTPNTITVIGCVSWCEGIPDGHYHSCKSCRLYVTCSNGMLFTNRPCPSSLVWDDNRKQCCYHSQTCVGSLSTDQTTRTQNVSV